MIPVLTRFNELALAAGRAVAWVLLVLMTGIVLYQVFFRYVLNDAPAWSEAAARALMLWMTFLVAPTAWRHGAYVSIGSLVALLPRRGRTAMSLATNLLALVLLAVMFWLSLKFVDRGLNRRAAGLPADILGWPVKAAWVRLAMPVGLVLMLSVGVELILRDLSALLRPDRAGGPDPELPDYMTMN